MSRRGDRSADVREGALLTIANPRTKGPLPGAGQGPPYDFPRPMKKSTIVLWVLLSLLLLLSPSMTAQENSPVADDPGYIVVVNRDNRTESLDSKTVERMFFKKWKRWDGDEIVVPVNQVNSEVREAFTKGIHKKDVSAILKYWQRMIFSGRDVPPPELQNDTEVLEFVKANRGAIGYVSSSTRLIEGVRELPIVEKEK